MKLEMYTFTNVAIRYWQSNRSTMPPWPGMMSPKSLILKALLNPLAKNPPNGPIMELKSESDSECNTNGHIVTVVGMLNCPSNQMELINRFTCMNRCEIPAIVC